MTDDPRAGPIEVRLRAMDTVVVLEIGGADAASLADEVRHVWGRCLVADDVAADVRIHLVLDPDADVVAAAAADGALARADRAHLLDALSPRVTVAAIDHQAGQLMMLHACGLAAADGRTIGFVGPSGTGKTTASQALGATLGYVTDETLAIRADGTIAAYPKPLSVKVEGASYKKQVSIDELGLGATPAAPVIAGLVVLSRDGADQPWLESVSTVRALAMLAPESSSLARIPRPLHTLAQIVDSTGGLRVLHYAEAAQLLPVALKMLERS